MSPLSPYPINPKACYFKIGSHAFAVEASYVKQIISLTQFSPVPRSSSYLWGLVAIESSILPLINSYELLALETAKPNLAIVLNHDNKPMAFALDEVIGFAELEPAETDSLTPSALPDAFRRFIKGQFFFQGNSYFSLDVVKLLALVETQLEVV